MAVESVEKGAMLKTLTETVRRLTNESDRIPSDRKPLLLELAGFIREKISNGQIPNLTFICTHNSRRSHMAQLWAQAAANYYGVRHVACFSGGTEATAFNPRAVEAMRKVGFDIRQKSEGQNPFYEVKFSDEAPSLKVFSKKYHDPFNPSKDFAAVMTCSHADENCPIVFGASKRIAVTYNDPKDFDGTPQEAEKYMERALQIGREMLFVFSQIDGRKM